MDAVVIDYDQVAHDMHRHFWPGSVEEKHTEMIGDCYKCHSMGEWLRSRLKDQPFGVYAEDEYDGVAL